MSWALLQQLFAQGSSYLVFLVLSAIVEPREIGLITLASASLAVLAAFTETGFGAAIIQRREVEPAHLSTTFAINVTVGAALSVLGVVLALVARAVYDAPALFPVMATLAAGFLIRSLGLTHATLAQRELRFRALAMRDLAAGITAGVVGVTMALRGYGVWSLVAVALVNAGVSVALIWTLLDWRPRPGEISRRHAAELWGYSSRILGFNLGKAFIQNSDRLVIGYLLGTHALGVYALASKLVITPVSSFVGAAGTYLFPAMSRLQGDLAAVRADYLRVTRVIMRVVVAYLIAVGLLAPLLVARLFGAEWGPAVRVIPWLAIAALAMAIFAPVGQLLKALNRPGWLLAWSIIFAILMLAGTTIGAHWGLVGAAIGYAAAHVVLLPTIAWLARRVSSFGLREAVLFWAGWPAAPRQTV